MRTSTSSELSDSELMMRLGHGDTQALGEIYLRYVSVVRSALRRQAPELPRAQREELTQDVFLSLLELVHPKSGRSYRDEERLKAFLYGVSIRKARMWRRQTWLRRHLLKRHADRPIAMAQAPEDGGSPAQHTEAREAVVHALSRLPQTQREVLLLHAEGFSGDEIACQLNIRPKTVWTRLHRARSTLLAVAVLSAGLCLLSFGIRDSRDGTATRTRPLPGSFAEGSRSKAAPKIARTNLTISSQTTAGQEASSAPRTAEVVDKVSTRKPVRDTQVSVQEVRSGKLSMRIAGSERTGPRVHEKERKPETSSVDSGELRRLRAAIIDGRLVEAESGLRAYLEHSARDATAWSLLGDCLRKLGKWRESVDAYRSVMRVGQGTEAQRARFLAASVLQDRLKDPRAVIALLEGYGEDQITTPEARLRLSRALVAVGEVRKARSTLDAILAGKPAGSIAQEARRLLDETSSAQP